VQLSSSEPDLVDRQAQRSDGAESPEHDVCGRPPGGDGLYSILAWGRGSSGVVVVVVVEEEEDGGVGRERD
jgi:hypothetical protein